MSMPDPSPAASKPDARLAALMDGYLTSQVLFVAARLGIAGVLAKAPQTAAAVAEAVGADPRSLHRVMRGLAMVDVLEEYQDGRFGLTALGAALRSDLPGSLHGAMLPRGEFYFQAAADLLGAVRDGNVAFERVFGMPVFDYLAQQPEASGAFQQSMSARSRREAVDIIDAYDFHCFNRIVDVGCGEGGLLAAILRAQPHLHGIGFDHPAVIERATTHDAGTELAPRCTWQAGDFFVEIPPGGDVYLLSRVIHDWDDDAARRILRNCHRAMSDGATLLILDAVLPERAKNDPAAIRLDLTMLLLTRGRERTGAEFEQLLRGAGFEVVRVVPTASPFGLSIVEAQRSVAAS